MVPPDASAGARTPRHLSHHLKVSPSQRLVPVLAAAGEAREWDGASSDLRVSPPPQPAALQPVTLLQYIIIRIQETYHRVILLPPTKFLGSYHGEMEY